MSTSDEIGSNAAQYLQALGQLTPKGKAWPISQGSNWMSLLQVVANICAAIDAQGCLLVDETFPDTTLQLLPNWERVAGLPDECSELGDTIQIRRMNLIAKLTSRGGQTIAYLISVAGTVGYVITITEFSQFRVDSSTIGDALCSSDWQYTFQVNAPSVSITWFRAGNATAGEPLAIWGNERLECIINKYKPAHTIALFAYS